MERALKNEEKLSPLIEGVVKLIQKEPKSERANQIYLAVEFHLKTWLHEVEKLNPLFKVSELIKVGSFAEGTKILETNEFDFLAVIEDLSKPGSVTVDNTVSDREQGLVKVAIADDRVKSRWNKLCKNGHLQCFQYALYPKEDESRFGHVVISVLLEEVRKGKSLELVTKTPTVLDCKIQLQTVNNISLFLKGVEFNAPNVLFTFELENRELTIDLSPAIRYHQIEDCFKAEDCVGPAFAELVLSRKSLLLVAKRDLDFRVTVTESEVQYMQSVLKKEHKLIYIFLKYIEKLNGDHLYRLSSFTSYMLKTVCINHDIKCRNKNRSVAECLKSVIRDLDVCSRQEYVTSIVNRHMHLQHTRFPEKRTIYGKTMLDGMRKLWQLPNEVNTVSEFDEFLMLLIQQERQRRDEENRLIQQAWDRSNRNKVSQLIDRGFEAEEVHTAIRATSYDLDIALEYLENVKIDKEKAGGSEKIERELNKARLKEMGITNHFNGDYTGAAVETSYGGVYYLEPTDFGHTDNPAQTMHVGECSHFASCGLGCSTPTTPARTTDPARFDETKQCQGSLNQQNDLFNDVNRDPNIVTRTKSTPVGCQLLGAVAQIVEPNNQDAPTDNDNKPVKGDNLAPICMSQSSGGLTKVHKETSHIAGQDTATCEILYSRRPIEESLVSPTGEQERATCEVS